MSLWYSVVCTGDERVGERGRA